MSGTFLDKSFSVAVGGNQQYRDNWEATFGKKPPKENGPQPAKESEPCFECGGTGRVWVSDEHHGHAVRVYCKCRLR